MGTEIPATCTDGHMSGGVGSSRIDVGPVHRPAVVAEHLTEEDPLASAVAVAERVDQRELGPVCSDRVGGGITIRGARQLAGDLRKDSVEFVGEELRPGVRDSKGAGVAGRSRPRRGRAPALEHDWRQVRVRPAAIQLVR